MTEYFGSAGLLRRGAAPVNVHPMRSLSRPIETASGDRWTLIIDLIGQDTGSVLDVGCRMGELREHLPEDGRYVGLDIFPPADVVASAEEPLPFDDDSFETVVLADVLEHLNDPHSALDEAMRVGRRSVVVLLPNLFTLVFRIYFAALGRMPSQKYAFGPDPHVDRHRWIMNFDQAASFTAGRAALTNWCVARECAYALPFRRRSARLAYRVAGVIGGPNLWSWEYAARLEPMGQKNGEPSGPLTTGGKRGGG
jgi:SAM-dependent methyltransferase